MHCRRPVILVLVVAAAALSLLATGCGGGGSSGAGVASVPSSTTTTTTTSQIGAVAYARCMRAHGVPGFPDPDGTGNFPKPGVVAARKSNAPAFDAADSNCRDLLPKGGLNQGPTITRADQLDYLKAAACMRRHGIPDFPDPTFQNGSVSFNIPSTIDPNTPVVQAALPICRKLIPAGLPYSGTN
jgi:hypothetical protein